MIRLPRVAAGQPITADVFNRLMMGIEQAMRIHPDPSIVVQQDTTGTRLAVAREPELWLFEMTSGLAIDPASSPTDDVMSGTARLIHLDQTTRHYEIQGVESSEFRLYLSIEDGTNDIGIESGQRVWATFNFDSGRWEIITGAGAGMGLTLLRLESDLCPMELDWETRDRRIWCPGNEFPSGTARIVNCASLLTEAGAAVSIKDFSNRALAHGSAAPNGDYGGDDCRDANLVLGSLCSDLVSGQASSFYQYAFGGSYFRSIRGYLGPDQATYPWRAYLKIHEDCANGIGEAGGQAIFGHHGEFLYGIEVDEETGLEYITLDPGCELDPIDCREFWAKLNECGQYEVWKYCCP